MAKYRDIKDTQQYRDKRWWYSSSIDWDREDLDGECFEYLEVKMFEGVIYNTCTHDTVWVCRCNCGRWGYVKASDLRCGRVTSCGCRGANKVDRFKFDRELTEMNEQ